MHGMTRTFFTLLSLEMALKFSQGKSDSYLLLLHPPHHPEGSSVQYCGAFSVLKRNIISALRGTISTFEADHFCQGI